MITTNVIYDHKNRDVGPIEVRVSVDRKSFYVTTGIRVRRDEFRFGMVVNRADSDALNERLFIITKRIDEEVNRCIQDGKPINSLDIRRQAWATTVDAASTSLLDWISEQIDALTLKEGTVKHYRTLLTRLREYGKIMRWQDLTVENICLFDSWLHSLTKPQSDASVKAGAAKEPLGDSAIYNYHKCFKALLNKAVSYDRLQVNPYSRLRGRFKRGEREGADFLTDEERDAIISLHPIPNTEAAVARDLFVFQMFTGLSYSDTQAFDIASYRLVDGTWRKVGERIKTGVPFVSQLLPPVVEILERYGMQVPEMENTHYNEMLKVIGQACGIGRPLHSHMARHTFATWMLRNGVPIEHVSRMLGHTNIVQTQRYAKIIAEDIHDDFARIANKINNVGD